MFILHRDLFCNSHQFGNIKRGNDVIEKKNNDEDNTLKNLRKLLRFRKYWEARRMHQPKCGGNNKDEDTTTNNL